MKINISDLKNKLTSKKENNKQLNRLNLVSICVFIIGIIIAFLNYFFTKNIVRSILILIVALLLTFGLYFYSSYSSKNKNKDLESQIKIEFINKLIEMLLAKQTNEESVLQAAKEIKSSSFKDLILSKYNEENNQFDKIELEKTNFSYDEDLQDKLNYILTKKINVNNAIEELLKIKDEILKSTSKLEYKMYEYTTFGVIVIFYLYFVLSMIFN